jgi:hypothetical protein
MPRTQVVSPEIAQINSNLKTLAAMHLLDPSSYQRVAQPHLGEKPIEEILTVDAFSPSNYLPVMRQILTSIEPVLLRKNLEDWRTRFKKEDPLNCIKLNQFDRKIQQAEIKEGGSRFFKALDLANIDHLKHLLDKVTLEEIQEDAQILHALLTPNLLVTRYKESTVSEIDPMPGIPDAILIFGNNDLQQIDFIAKLYHQYPVDKKPLLYFCSFGGHGTLHRPIFSFTEAESLSRRMEELGVSRDNMVMEYESTDTGSNIRLLEQFILVRYILGHLNEMPLHLLFKEESFESGVEFLNKMMMKKRQPISPENQLRLNKILASAKEYLESMKETGKEINLHRNILISGTPAALLRQLRSFEQQATLPWHKISCQSPGIDDLLDYYYSNSHVAGINFIYALRELSTFLDYTLHTDYVTKNPIDEDLLGNAAIILSKYFEHFTRKKVAPEDIVAEFVTKLETGQPSKLIKEIAHRFRLMFFYVEVNHLKELSSLTASPMSTVAEQSAVLDHERAWSRLGP